MHFKYSLEAYKKIKILKKTWIDLRKKIIIKKNLIVKKQNITCCISLSFFVSVFVR